MADVAELAQTLTLTLVPCLPFLLKMGEKAGEEVAKRIGGDAWDQVKHIWSTLGHRVDANTRAKRAAEQVAETQEVLESNPEDADSLHNLEMDAAAFRNELEKMLISDPALMATLAPVQTNDAVLRLVARRHGEIEGIRQQVENARAQLEATAEDDSRIKDIQQIVTGKPEGT